MEILSNTFILSNTSLLFRSYTLHKHISRWISITCPSTLVHLVQHRVITGWRRKAQCLLSPPPHPLSPSPSLPILTATSVSHLKREGTGSYLYAEPNCCAVENMSYCDFSMSRQFQTRTKAVTVKDPGSAAAFVADLKHLPKQRSTGPPK